MKWTLSKKIGFGTAAVLLLVLGMGLSSALSHQSLLDQLRTLVDLNLPVDRVVTRIALHNSDVHDRLEALLGGANSPALSDDAARELRRQFDRVDQALLEAITLTAGSRARSLPQGFKRIDRSVIRLKREYQQLQESAEVLASSTVVGDTIAVAATAKQVKERLALTGEHIDELIGLVEESTHQSLAAFEARVRTAAIGAVVVAIVGVIIGFVFFTVIGNASTRIRRLATDAGELAVAIRNDELPEEQLSDQSVDEIGTLGNALDSMVDALRANVSHRQQLIHQLHESASVDELTGALSRHRFTAVLKDEIARAQRYSSDVSLIHFDVDNMAKINERHGNETGDYVLRTIAEIVRHNLRKTDSFVRWTGGSFFILATETPLTGATYVAEKSRRNIEMHPFDAASKVTISCGVVQLAKDEENDLLIQRAETALARAKTEGRNRVVAG